MENLLFESSSSSSSSDDEDNFLATILPEVLEHHQKNELYAESIIPSYTDKEFMEHFKVPRSVLFNLAEEFAQSEYYPKKDTGFSRIDAEKCMWVFCWYATHEAASFRDVADRFNIALSTLHLIIENISVFISNKSKEIIKWPSEEEKNFIMEDFASMGFPDVLGCVDGSHVRIDKPTEDHESYYNRKKYYSIQFQAVCDSKRRIRDVFIGFPGSVHDSRVFQNSPLYVNLPALCKDKYILGDSAYPCLRNLLTPYKNNGHLSPVETNFNKKLSHCRVLIEHTFGLLKQKFRQLYHLKLRSIPTICHFIRACCVLHNLSLEEFDEEVADGEDIDDVERFPDNQEIDEEAEGNVVGLNFRNYIASMLHI
ncbi:putative nuclease HARBI1 [Coccinella septempunctata]|uniref:putative nuclease HARBI1 n=1 Tax=Coccinella septempunctata TaxID=41139 RepID=UPI001D06CDBF|nr:putative nuclease HARBI1 [Coccinella septempunctata]